MSATLQTAAPAIWMSARRHPYDRARRDDEGRGPAANMHDISSHPSNAIALSGVNLALGRGAARVHILRQIDTADGDDRTGAAGYRFRHRRRPGIATARRGRSRALSRQAYRHRVSGL